MNGGPTPGQRAELMSVLARLEAAVIRAEAAQMELRRKVEEFGGPWRQMPDSDPIVVEGLRIDDAVRVLHGCD